MFSTAATQPSLALRHRAGLAVAFGLLAACSKDAPITSRGSDETPEAGKPQTDRERSGTFSATTAPEVEPVSNPTGIGPSGLFNPANVLWQDWLIDECPAMKIPKPGESLGPPIRWKPCEGDVPGCQELEVTWEHTSWAAYRAAQVSTYEGSVALSVHVETASVRVPDAVVRWKFLATAEGTNLGAWTTSGTCGSVSLGTAGDHHCLGVGRSTAGKETIGFVALIPKEDPMTSTPIIAPMNAMGNFDCSEKLIRGSDTAGRKWSYNIGQRQEEELILPGGTPFAGSLFEDYYFITRGGADENGEFLDGWVWTPEGGARPLVQPSTGFVYDLRTDGKHLVWMVGTGAQVLDYNPAEVWAAPLTLDRGELEPRKIGSVPSIMPGEGIGVVGAGYYAVTHGNLAPNSGEARELHVFDLSSGKHWNAPKPEATEPNLPLYIDGQEVWYMGQREDVVATIIRQRLDDLVEVE